MHESIVLGTQLVPDECSFPSKVLSSFKIQILVQILRFRPTHLCKSQSSLYTYGPALSAELPTCHSHLLLSLTTSSVLLGYISCYPFIPMFPHSLLDIYQVMLYSPKSFA